MDPNKKQAYKLFVINILQLIASAIAFIAITYILFNIRKSNEYFIYLSLYIVIIGFMINSIFTFIKDIKLKDF